MKYKRPLILGVGSLGSILCEKISKNNFEKMTVIDYDTVKERNLRNSIFNYEDIGKKKVDIIHNKFKDRILTDCFDFKFNENKLNDIYDSDLIIDCRDFLYDRKNIDIRLFVYDKSLIIDCRKNVNYSTSYEGTYFWNITKRDLTRLINKFVKLIKDDDIDGMLENKEVNQISLSSTLKIPTVSNFSRDIIVDYNSKISNPEVVNNINMEDSKNIDIKFYNTNSEIKSKTLVLDEFNENNILNEINSLIPNFDNNNYLLVLQNNEILIIPETGAA